MMEHRSKKPSTPFPTRSVILFLFINISCQLDSIRHDQRSNVPASPEEPVQPSSPSTSSPDDGHDEMNRVETPTPTPTGSASPPAELDPDATEDVTVIPIRAPLPQGPFLEEEAVRVVSNAFFDMFPDHNQTLDAWRSITSEPIDGLSRSERRVLVHVDYHSDMYRNNRHLEGEGYEGIGNYVNALISGGDVSEVWWIVPDLTMDDPIQRSYFWGKPNQYSDWQYRDGPLDQVICLGKERSHQGQVLGREMRWGPPTSLSCQGDDKVMFHKRTLSMLEGNASRMPEGNLPINHLVGRKVILDLDADFFDYNGLYANWGFEGEPRNYQRHLTPESLAREFRRVVAALDRIGVSAELVTCATSPEYVSQNKLAIESFFRHLGARTKSGRDLLVGYAHRNGGDGNWRGRGKVVQRDVEGQVAFDLFSADRWNGRHKRIDIDDDRAFPTALILIERSLGWDHHRTRQYLIDLAAAQGHSDYIDLEILARVYDEFR